MARVQYSSSSRFRCNVHGFRASSVWVMPDKQETSFVPFYGCLHCAAEIVGKGENGAVLDHCSREQVQQIRERGWR